MSNEIERRRFLRTAWQGGLAAIAAAGAWTTWDLLKPKAATGFGGVVKAVPPDAVPKDGVLEIPAARAYLVDVKGDVIALSQKCTHLGCHVPYCESSGMFECPCHGSVFNRAGDLQHGPAPRGLDRYPVDPGEQGVLYINTGETVEGPPPGTATIQQKPSGPPCAPKGA